MRTDHSFQRVNYLLRPSKQVERKLIIEALHKLSLGAIDIRQYTYVGLGSIYYADFQLFHKYLYIDKMTCLEAAPIPKRMKFNKPYGFIKLRMENVADFIPRLNRTVPYFMWLDYDSTLGEEMVQDIKGCIHRLGPGSILVVTVDADPDHLGLSNGLETDTRRIVSRLRDEFGKYYPDVVGNEVVAYNILPRFFAVVLRSLIGEEINARSGIKFLQLFNFKYADGAQMVTIGGLLADRKIADQVTRSGVYQLPYVTRENTPIPIAVPLLTVREKQWLDENITEAKRPSKVAFEIGSEELGNFRSFYKHYPTYHETLV